MNFMISGLVVFSFLLKKLGIEKRIGKSHNWWWVVLGFELWFAERCREYTYVWGKSILGKTKTLRRPYPWCVTGTTKILMKLEHRDLGREW